jgi:hypothetical protein
MPRPRLKVGDISIREIKILSDHLYKKEVDNKAKRAKIDVVEANITAVKNLIYKDGRWVQKGREMKFEFIVKTKPKSYKKTDNIPIHKFPITFLLREFHKGFDSAFRWRTGSFKKPKFSTQKISEGRTEREKNRIRRKNKKLQEWNILNGIQLQFFFDLERILKQWGLLYGPDWTNGPPDIRNKEKNPFFDKHAYHIVTKVLPNLLVKYGQELSAL